MSLIDRYVDEVGSHLPEKNREDIEAEIRSMVEDMIDERSHQTGKPVNDEVIAAVLEELGDPKLLASKYAPPKRFLIGPNWYEVYVKTLQRVLFTALPIVAVVIFILRLTESPLDFIGAVGEAVGSVFDVGLQILFWVTIVFVSLERSEEKPIELQGAKTQTWTVAQLPKLPKKRQISIFETVFNIASILFVMIWIVRPLVLDRFRGEASPVPFLHPNLWNLWLPVFFVLMSLTVIHEAFKLKIGNWTPALTVTNVILGVVTIIYVATLVITQDVINPAFLITLDSAGVSELREVITWSINISAAVIGGIYVWSMIESIRLARQLKQTS